MIYNEARDLPSALNYINFPSSNSLTGFIGDANYPQLSAIRHVQLMYSEYDTHHWGLLRTLANLTALRLVVLGLSTNLL
jgi:hypothetical protein